MKRGLTLYTVSLLLVCFCLTSSGSATTSVTANKSGRKYLNHGGFTHGACCRVGAHYITCEDAGAAGRHMLQETNQSPAHVHTTEHSHESTQQAALVNATENSNDSKDTPTDETQPGAAKSGKAETDGEAAEAASESESPTLSPGAESKEGKTNAEESSSLSISRQRPELSPASSTQLLQNKEASPSATQAAATSDADKSKPDSSASTQATDRQAADLTFDEALAQTASGAELSDHTRPSSSNQSTSADLTFDQAVAANHGTQNTTDAVANSTKSIASGFQAIDSQEASPVLESLSPSVENFNGSLSAAIQKSKGASNATAASRGEDSHLNGTHWTGLANATVIKVGEELVKTANASTSLLNEGVSATPMNASVGNTTRDIITGAASSAAGALATASSLLSNATSALAATTNTTALNATNTTVTAGGSESDSLLGSEVLNATVADGVLHSSVDKVTGVLGGMKSWLNSSKADDGKQGLQGLTGTTDLAVQSSGTTANTTADSNITSGDASLQGRPAAHTPIKGVTGAIANATDAVVSLSQAAAAELGTEEGTANTTNTLQHSGSVWPAYTQATGSANLTGTNSSTDAVAAAAAALANPTGSASKAASLADERAAEAAQDKAEQRMSQQASSLTQPKGTAANAQKPNKQPHTLEDEVDAEFLVMQNRRDASAGTAGIGAASAKTARYADGQLTTHGMSPSELAELNEEHDNFVDPTWSRAQAQHKTALGGSTAGSHTSGRGAFPADTHRTQTGQLLGNEDDADDFNPQAALTNFQSGRATGTSQHNRTAPTFGEEYGDGDEGDVLLSKSGAASSSALTAGSAASQAARAKTQEGLGLSGRAVDPQAASSTIGAQSAKRPQAGISATQGTSSSALSAGSQSGSGSLLPGSSGVSQPRKASDALGQTGGTNNYDDHVDEIQPLGPHTRSGFATGSESARASSKALPSVGPLSSKASGTLTPAQQRELERESAYEASTGSAAADLIGASSGASGNSKSSQPSWGAIAGRSDAGAAQTGASVVGSKPGAVDELPKSSIVKQQSMGDGESEADMEDYDPRAFAVGSTDSIKRTAGALPADPTGQAQAWNPRTSQANTGTRVQPSMGGEEAFEEQEQDRGSRGFVANRDPTDPNSVVSAQQGGGGQLQAGHQHSTGVNAAGIGSATAAETTKMNLHGDEDVTSPLLAGAQAAKQSGSKHSGSSSYTSDDDLAGPVVTGVGGGKTVARQQSASKQFSGASSTLHGVLDNVINNWVVITALSALVCTGAVLGFVFLRGLVPSPYDAITISNSGNGGYAGNNGYQGVSREDEENGWEGWADDDEDVHPRVKKSSNGNSPPRGTGVGKLKKGTFAKKKPANWSNDF